jgi:hypothetical protein
MSRRANAWRNAGRICSPGHAKSAKKKKQRDRDEYTIKIFRIRNLKMAGYPFGVNDMTLEGWEDLGTVKEAMKCPTKAQ